MLATMAGCPDLDRFEDASPGDASLARAGLDRASLDDASLAQRAGRGDRAALELLLQRHFDRVHAVCRRVLVNPADVEEARQDALIAIATKIRTFRGDGPFSFVAWVNKVASNAAIDKLRRVQKKEEPFAELPADAVSSSDPERAVLARLDVQAILQRLSAEHRAVIVLADMCELEYEEIAHVLGVPLGTVRSRLARARQQFLRLSGTSPR